MPLGISSWVLPFTIFLITLWLCFKSYTPNTFLTGWDTLHPEFNFTHAFSSVLNGVWRSDQGLGAIAAHSHMSELPRLLYLKLTSFVLPLQFLRYSYVFLCLIVGPVGMFFALKKFFNKSTSTAALLAATVGAASYVLNLGTVQRFAVPFEMFTTQFAVLPWLFLSAISYLETSKKRYLVTFVIASFLGSSQAYAATLFYAYAALFSITILVYAVLTRVNKNAIRNAALILVALFATNAYWLLPNLYSIKNQSQEIASAHINELFTPEAVLHNEAWGSLVNVISQKNYLFSWQAYDFQKNAFVDLLSNWNSHLSNPAIAAIPTLFAVLSLLGIIVSIFKKNKLGVSLIIPTVLSIFVLMNINGPFGGFYTFLQSHSGILAEGFRDSFTKFSTIFSFFLAYYAAFFLAFLFEVISKIKKLVIIPFVLVVFLLSSLGLLMKPAFSDGLVSPLMRVSIPTEYFDAFNWFKGNTGRIAQMPLNTMWGWQYNSWGYQGAGFFWFGVDNPYLTRDFDRWNAQNETFYKELSRSYYANDTETFHSLLEKYQVQYLVLDGSIFDPGVTDKTKLSKDTEKFLSKVPHIQKVATYGFIEIYKLDIQQSDVTTPSPYSKVSANATYSPVDYAFDQYGTYVSGLGGVWKPFVNFDSREMNSTSENNWITLKATTPELKNQSLTIPNIVKREAVLPVKVSVLKTKLNISVRLDLIQPKISIDGKELDSSPVYITTSLSSNANAGYLAIESTVFDISDIQTDESFHAIGVIDVNSTGKTKLQLFTKNPIENKGFLSDLKDKNASWCIDPTNEGGLTTLPNGFSLTSHDQSVCIGSLVTLSKSALYETTFMSPTGSSSLFCLNQIGKDGCVNVLPPTATEVFGGRTIKSMTPLESGNYWFAFVGQSQPNAASVSTYDNLNLKYYPEISRNYVDFGSNYGIFASEQNIPLESVHQISVSYFESQIISENFLLQRGHSTAVNCSVPEKGEVTKNFIGNEVVYKASNNGVSCDYFDYPQLLQTQAYVMKISGHNESGRSVKFYLENKQSEHMDTEELLPKNTFSQEYTLLPFASGDGGYVVNLETRAFDSIASQNSLTEISFSPIPLNWLSEIGIGPKESIVSNNELKVRHTASAGLITKVETTGKGIVAFNQAYENGWIALSVSGKKLEHITVNGWENGWVVPENTNILYIFYLPEALEFLGFGILIVATYSLIKSK